MVEIAAGVIGVVLVAITLRDVFQSVVVPRAVDRRLRTSAYVTRFLWRIWPALAFRYKDEERRENFLATFAPFAMVAQLFMWVVILVAGYGLIFFAMRDQITPHPRSLWEAMYFAGTTMLTIGFGDIVATTGFARLIALAAGTSGLSVVAVVTAYLFAVFAAFQKREVFVTYLGTRSGSPPSGVGLLSVHAFNNITADLPAVFSEGQHWAIEVMESHLAYPMLAYFRSSHDYESWVGALGSLLDAATLLVTTVDGNEHGQARLMYWSGRHLVHDFVNYFGLKMTEGVGIEQYEFLQARARLSELGFKVADETTSWKAFAEMRATYAPGLASMAAFWNIPPLEWIGDRSLVSVQHIREQFAEEIDTETIV